MALLARVLARGNPRIDVEPHGGPPTVPSHDRFWPNPAEVPEALQRLPYDTIDSAASLAPDANRQNRQNLTDPPRARTLSERP
jgi:hypothetical protein